MNLQYVLQRRNQKNGLTTKPAKEPYAIAKQSEKKKEQIKNEKPAKDLLNDWFNDRRVEMIGTCQCGCGRPSSKDDDQYFKCSASHIFPKAIFKSIMLQPLNCVERNFWDGCHHNMDFTSIERWPAFADWEDIKERFKILAPLISKGERKHKFFTTLENLVNAN